MTVYIYALKHPVTKEVFYVGRTRRPNARLSQHRTKPSTPKLQQWKTRLESEGLQAEQVILETTDEIQGRECESKWVRHFANTGSQIVNANYVPEGKRRPAEQGITVQEAAKRIGVARSTVNAWVRSGRVRVLVEGHKGNSAGTCIHPEDIERERHRMRAEIQTRIDRLEGR